MSQSIWIVLLAFAAAKAVVLGSLFVVALKEPPPRGDDGPGGGGGPERPKIPPFPGGPRRRYRQPPTYVCARSPVRSARPVSVG